MAPKAPTTCNWVKSIVTDSTLDDFVKTGYLPKKEVMPYRAPHPDEEIPQPKDGEVVVFTDHMNRGFTPPGSKNFRDVLRFFDPIPCLTSATSKCSAKFILVKNQTCYFPESCSI